MWLGRRYWRWNHRVAQLYLRSRRAHPVRWQFIDLGAGIGMVAILWAVIGRTAGIAFAILWCLLMVLGLFSLGVRRRQVRRDSGL
jgi:hypothetical protein